MATVLAGSNRRLVVAVLLALASVGFAFLSVTGSRAVRESQDVGSDPRSYQQGTITADGDDRYLVTRRGTGFDVMAPTSNDGGNLREALVDAGTERSVDQQACVTWEGPGGATVQPGLVLRSEVTPERTRAIMVTNNVFLLSRTSFNVHVADSSADPALRLIAQVPLPDSVGPSIHETQPLPWRLCARVRGRELELKVWPLARVEEEPSWGDPTFVGGATLPADWVRAGRPGFYIGHLPPGESTSFSEAETGAG